MTTSDEYCCRIILSRISSDMCLQQSYLHPDHIRLRPSNARPSDMEAAIAREQLTISDEELRRLDIDLALLLAMRARIVDRIDKCMIILAPHKNIPPELISEIISYLASDSLNFPPMDGVYDPRLQITQVCRLWRKIAFNMPLLWDIKYSQLITGRKFNSSLQLANAWFSQCAGSRLALELPRRIMTQCLPRTCVLDTSLVERLVLPYTNRLKSLSLVVTPGMLDKILTLPTGSFKNIEALNLRVHPPDENIWDHPIPAFTSAASLRSVTLSDLPKNLYPKLHLPWAQLTSLSLSNYVEADQLLVILSNCTSLKECSLFNVSPITPEITSRIRLLPYIPLRLPVVETLQICFQPWFNAVNILPLLEFTSLSSLTISPPSHLEGTTPVYTTFLWHMASTLRYFKLLYIPGAPITIDDAILSNIPNAQSVVLPHNCFLLPSTIEKIGQGELLPKVERLEFAASDIGPVVEMLTMRQSNARCPYRSVSNIMVVHVFCRYWSEFGAEQLNKELSDLRSKGMDVIVTDWSWVYKQFHDY